jgi:hypothetical protein
LDFFLWESSVQFFCTVLHWVTEILGVIFLNLLYILVINPSLDV